MYSNGANGYPNHFPANNYGGGFNRAANQGFGYMPMPHQPKPQPQPKNELWCLPIQNFRIDGGTTNLYSQKVSFEWPEFRPQSSIFSGPRVKQDTTDLNGMPAPNFNFDDCGYTNFSGGFMGGGFPGMGGGFPGMGGGFPGMGGGFPGMGGGAKGGMPIMGGGVPNMGGGAKDGAPVMGGFPNMGFPNLPSFPHFPGFPNLPGFPMPGGPIDHKDAADGGKSGPLSGKGTIDGASFRSGDGERYELKVESGKSYNLLSDAGVGLNGTYGTVAGETVLTDIALSVGGKIVTLASDGTFRVDGKAFDKKNNLGGLVTESKNGTYTIKANGYEFELKASENGIKVKIDAKNARSPEGLWGVSLDGEKNTESELQRAIKESDYKIDDALTFDYEDNNNIGEKYIPTLDEEERNALAWNARNPQLPRAGWNLRMGINNRDLLDGANRFVMHGPNFKEDDSEWTMDKLVPNKFYNVFSDEGVQVNGRFEGGLARELGFVVDGETVRVERTATGIKVTVNDQVVTSYTGAGITFDGTTVKIVSDSDEAWRFEVKAGGSSALDFFAESENAGANATRSTGLLGDTIRQNMGDIDASNNADKNGAGYLRNADGSLSKAGQDMSRALREYMVDSWDDTSSGRSVYE
jgi:hypothetical protein